jgi:hypothetical protein
MDDSTESDSNSDSFPLDDLGTTGGSAAEGFRQFGRWLKDHLRLGTTSNSEEDSDQ